MRHCLVLLALASVLQAQERGGKGTPEGDAKKPAGESIDASFGVPEGRPLLVTRTVRLDGKALVKAGKGESELPMKLEDELQFIDEHRVNEVDREESIRHFVRAANTTNGDVTDPPLAGMKGSFTREGKEVGVKLLDDNVLPQRNLQQLLNTQITMGAWLELPKDATVGGTRDVNLLPLAPILLSSDLVVEKAKARLKLESFDEATGIASFRGRAAMVEKGKLAGVDCKVTYDLECSLSACPRESRIVSMHLEGKYTFQGDGPVQISGGGACAIDLRTELGEAVKKARAERARPRENDILVPDVGVRFKLSSLFTRLEPDILKNGFFRSGKMGNDTAHVVVDTFAGDGTKAKQVFDGMAIEMKKTYKDLKVEKVTCPLGPGQAFLLSEKKNGVTTRIRSEIYPFADKFIVFKLLGTPAGFTKALPEFRAASKTLRKLK